MSIRFRMVSARLRLLIGITTAVTLMIGYVPRWYDWIGSWIDTGQAFGKSMILVAPLAAALAAWVAAGPRRRKYQAIVVTAARPMPTVLGRIVAEIYVCVLAGWVLGGAPAWGVTAAHADFSHPNVAQYLPVIGALLTAVAYGVLLGVRLPPVIAVPAAAGTVYVGLGFLSFYAPDLLNALTPLDDRPMTYYYKSTWVYLVQATWLVLLAVAIALLGARAGRPSTVFALIAGFAAAPLLLIGLNDRHPSAAALRPVCSGQPAVTVCMTSAHAHLMPAMRVLGGELVTPLIGLLDQPVILKESSIPQRFDAPLEARFPSGSSFVAFSPMFGFNGEANWIDRDEEAVTMASAVMRSCPDQAQSAAAPTTTDPQALNQRPTATVTQILDRWYLRKLRVPIDGSAMTGSMPLDDTFINFTAVRSQASWFDALSPEQRQIWFKQHRQAIQDCSLTLGDFHS